MSLTCVAYPDRVFEFDLLFPDHVSLLKLFLHTHCVSDAQRRKKFLFVLSRVHLYIFSELNTGEK